MRAVIAPIAPRTIAQLAIFGWGLLGTIAVVVEPAARLLIFANRTLKRAALGPFDIALFVGFSAFILYAEGYRGFQKRFSPRAVARAVHLSQHPRPLMVALAPLYCMALIGAPRRRLIASWVLVAAIVGVVLFVRQLPPVTRAIIDVGVGCALVWGALSLVVYAIRALRGRAMPVPAETI